MLSKVSCWNIPRTQYWKFSSIILDLFKNGIPWGISNTSPGITCMKTARCLSVSEALTSTGEDIHYKKTVNVSTANTDMTT